jgi:hypothetical protein
MTDQNPRRRPDDLDPLPDLVDLRLRWANERRERIVREIQANRRGEYRVPTWVLGLALALMIIGVVAVLVIV